jgi:hypothetical protein
MAIFRKKRNDTLAVPSAPFSQSTVTLDERYGSQTDSAVVSHPSWNVASQSPGPSDGPPQYQPGLGQEYLAPPTPHKYKKLSHSLSRLNLASMTNILSSDVPKNNQGPQMFNHGLPEYQQQEAMEGPRLRDIISAKFNTIVTLIDGEKFGGDEADLSLSQSNLPIWQQEEVGDLSREVSKRSKGAANKANSKLEFSNGNYFSKVYLYANSRLPRSLPPMKLYVQLSMLSNIPDKIQLSADISSTLLSSAVFRTSLRETCW